MNWLVLYHVTTTEEKDLFLRILNSVRKRKITGVVDILFLHTKNDKVIETLFYHISLEGETVKERKGEILDILEVLFPHYDGFIYSGHSSGYLFGEEQYPIFSILDLTEISRISGNKFKVSIFDTCYVNNLETLYELRNFSDYIIATPSFCEDRSVLELDTFFDLNLSTHNIVDNLKAIIDEYITEKSGFPDFWYYGTCRGALRLSLVDTSQIDKLAMCIKNVSPILEYDESTIIHSNDPKLHHLCDVILNALDDGRLLEDDFEFIRQTLDKTVLHSKSSDNTDSCHHNVCIGIYSELPLHPLGEIIEYFTF